MDLMQMGTQLLASKLGSGANSGAITSALGGLLSGGDGKPSFGRQNRDRRQLYH